MSGESEVLGGVLNLISTNYPDHGHYWHMIVLGIEPETSRLVIGGSDHQATRLVSPSGYTAGYLQRLYN